MRSICIYMTEAHFMFDYKACSHVHIPYKSFSSLPPSRIMSARLPTNLPRVQIKSSYRKKSCLLRVYANFTWTVGTSSTSMTSSFHSTNSSRSGRASSSVRSANHASVTEYHCLNFEIASAYSGQHIEAYG